MSPPMIAGYGMGNGFELYLQDKAGGNIAAFQGRGGQVRRSLVATTRNRRSLIPPLPRTIRNTGWISMPPNVSSRVCRRRCAFHIVGLLYRTNMFRLNRFSKLYHVTMQAPAEYRVNAESLHHMYVRASDGGISPLSRVRAPDQDQRPVRPHPFQPVQRHLD